MDVFIKTFVDGKGTFYQRVQISDNIWKDPDTGFLYCKNSILGHIGKQAYNGYEVGIADKKVVFVTREAVDVFDENSLESFEGKIITLNHPDEMVNSENAKKYWVGHIQNVKRDGDNIVGDIVIQVQDAIDKVESGELKDLSLGYNAKLVPTKDGGLKQTEIVINHLAIVAEGRAKNARIVDEQTVTDEDTVALQDAIHINNRETHINETDTYDDETNKSTNSRVVVEHSTHEVIDDKPNKENASVYDENKEGEKELKTFIDFMNDLKQINAMPKSEFKDKAYEALNAECKEVLDVDLPAMEVIVKDSAIEKSVGLKDTKIEEEEQPKPLVAYSQDEEYFFDNLYRSFDNADTAKKYASMTSRDVYRMLKEGKK